MEINMNIEEAWALLKEYNKDEFHLEHAQIVGKTMRYFAQKLGYGDECIRRSIVLRVRRLCVREASMRK